MCIRFAYPPTAVWLSARALLVVPPSGGHHILFSPEAPNTDVASRRHIACNIEVSITGSDVHSCALAIRSSGRLFGPRHVRHHSGRQVRTSCKPQNASPVDGPLSKSLNAVLPCGLPAVPKSQTQAWFHFAYSTEVSNNAMKRQAVVWLAQRLSAGLHLSRLALLSL